MHRRQALFVLFQPPSPLPPALGFLSRGVVIDFPDQPPHGWSQASVGRLGQPHPHLFTEEIRYDCSEPRDLYYLPFPIDRRTYAVVQGDFFTFYRLGSGWVLFGRRHGNCFQLPALDFNEFRTSAVRGWARPLPSLPKGGGPVAVFCHWQGGSWDPTPFQDLEWVDWGALRVPRNALRPPIVSESILEPAAKLPLLNLGLRRCSTPRSPGLVPPPTLSSPPTCAEDSYVASLKGVARRSLGASMQGEVQLGHQGKKFHFLQGRLAHFQWGHRPEQRIGPVRSWIEVEGRRVPFVGVSSVAIEGDREWGLRESLVAESVFFLQPGRMVVDYLLIEDMPELIVSLSVRWPVFRRPVEVNAWAPWEFPLGAFGPFHRPQTGVYTNGSWEPLARADSPAVGTALRVTDRGQSILFRFYQGQCYRPHFLSHRWSAGRLWLNPEGSYHPTTSQELDGYTEHYNWALRWQDFGDWPPEPEGLVLPPLIQN